MDDSVQDGLIIGYLPKTALVVKIMLSDEQTVQLTKRLDIIIQLLLEHVLGNDSTTTKKIEKLVGYGLSNSEVANLIGRKANYVAAVAGRKKPAKSKRGA